MKFRSTLVLLVVLAALGGYVFWTGRAKPDAASAPAAAIPVLQLDQSSIRAVEVRGEGKQVRVERAANGWQVQAPTLGPADAFRITEVISGLAKLQATQLITPTGQNLAPYGLDKPAYDVQLDGGAPEILHLGAKNPDGSATYVQLAAAPTIYLVQDSSIDALERWVADPPLQPTPAPTAPPLTVLPTVPAAAKPTVAPVSPGPPLRATAPALLPTATTPLSLTLPLAPTPTP